MLMKRIEQRAEQLERQKDEIGREEYVEIRRRIRSRLVNYTDYFSVMVLEFHGVDNCCAPEVRVETESVCVGAGGYEDMTPFRHETFQKLSSACWASSEALEVDHINALVPHETQVNNRYHR
jgi:hypothetical protein